MSSTAPSQWGKLPLGKDVIRLSVAAKDKGLNNQGRRRWLRTLRISWGRDIQGLLGQLAGSKQIQEVYVSISYAQSQSGASYMLLQPVTDSAQIGHRMVDKSQSVHARTVSTSLLPDWLAVPEHKPVSAEWVWSPDHRGVLITIPPTFLREEQEDAA